MFFRQIYSFYIKVSIPLIMMVSSNSLERHKEENTWRTSTYTGWPLIQMSFVNVIAGLKTISIPLHKDKIHFSTIF